MHVVENGRAVHLLKPMTKKRKKRSEVEEEKKMVEESKRKVEQFDALANEYQVMQAEQQEMQESFMKMKEFIEAQHGMLMRKAEASDPELQQFVQ